MAPRVKRAGLLPARHSAAVIVRRGFISDFPDSGLPVPESRTDRLF